MSVIIFKLVRTAFEIFKLLLILRVLVSWFLPNRQDPILFKLFRLTDPILEPIQKILPIYYGIDFSPWIVLILLDVLQGMTLGILRSLLF